MRIKLFGLAVALSCTVFATLSAADVGVARIKHAPSISGTVDGSVQQMLGESVTLNGGAVVTADMLVPGLPDVRLNGNPSLGGSIDGGGAATPVNYQVTLNGNALLGRLVRRTDPIALPTFTAPPQPKGTRTVAISSGSDTPGDFATLKNLTLNGGVGQFAVPPGTYGDFTANGGSGFTLGVAGSVRPVVYNFQHLTLNGQTEVRLVGPVIINLANALVANGTLGSSPEPRWLVFNIYSGGFTLNGGATCYGYVTAPNGTVIVNGRSQLIGGVVSDRLTVNGGGLLRLRVAAPFNQPPVAQPTAVTTDEDAPVGFTLLGTDPDNDTLTYNVVTLPSHGSLSGSGANRVYTPYPNYNGKDELTFYVSDGQLDSATATVTITINPVNDAPVADPKAIVLDEDTSAPVTFSGFDVEGSPLTFTATDPQHGTLTGSGATRTYTPFANYNGLDSFTYTASDGALSSAPEVVQITVRSINDAPEATPLSYAGIVESTPVNVTLVGTDVDNDPLMYAYTQPAHGSLTGTAPNLVYRSVSNYSGVDTFTYTVSDGQLTSAPATVTLAVNNPNDPPTAKPQSVSTAEDTALAIALEGTDPDNDPLTFTVVALPQHGTLSGSGANRTYTPDANYNGADSFKFTVRDQQFESSPATVTITVTPVNDAPVATPQTLETAEDTSLAIALAGTDVENSPLTFTVTADPQHGTLSGTGANRVYTPAKDYNGPDSFTFKVNDGELDSGEATVAINVTPVNDAPVATPQTVAATEDVPVAITLAATDVDSSAFTFSIVDPPVHGTLIVDPDHPEIYTYTPAPNYNGTDTFTFKANDGELDSAPASVSLNIAAVNDPPVATDQSISVLQDGNVTLTLGATDVDGDALTYAIVSGPAHGTISGDGPNRTYTPAPGYYGPDSFTFKATDVAQADSNVATVTVAVIHVNHPPTASDQSFTLDEDTTQAITLAVADSDGDALTYTLIQPPAHGALSGFPAGAVTEIPTVVYAPDSNYDQGDSFKYSVTDGGGTTATATVTLTMRPVNDAPIANPQAVTTREDTPLTIALSGSDIDSAALGFTVLTQPTHGTLSAVTSTAAMTASVVYTPAANYNGPDAFTYQANDGALNSAAVSVTITVTPVNDAPVAATPAVTTPEDTPVAITLKATDVENDPLTFQVLTQPPHGSLSGSAPNLTYTPAANYNGPDSFTYIARDTAAADSNIATVAITVTPVNDAPVAVNQSVVNESATATAIVLTASDVDGDALSFQTLALPAHGTLTGTAPNLTYTSTSGYLGTDSFTFKANDGTADSAPATVSISVVAYNAPPVVNAGPDQQIQFVPNGNSQVFGRIVVNNDEWAFTDDGFANSPYAAQFARNVASYLVSGKPGAKLFADTNVLSGSVDFIYTGAKLATTLRAAGYSWTTSSTMPITLANLQQYDAVFVGANSIDNQVLIDYVKGGGSVYVSAGTHWCGCDAAGEAALWNKFLNYFGLNYAPNYNGIGGTLPVTAVHELFTGVASLYFNNGNSVSRLNNDDPFTDIPFTYNGQGLFGVYGAIANQVFLRGTVTDDGKPVPPGAVTYHWTQVAGPQPANIFFPSSIQTRVEFFASGNYTFRLTADDGAKTAYDEVSISVNLPPRVYAGPDQFIRETAQPVTLSGTVQDDNVVHVPDLLWKQLTGPATAPIAAPTSATTSVTFTAPGIYIFEFSANDGYYVAKDLVEIRVGLSMAETPSGIAAWWPLNFAPYDVISGTHPLTLGGAANYGAGMVGAGLAFDGSNSSANTPGHPDLDVGASAAGMSVEFWARWDQTGDRPLFAWHNGSNETVRAWTQSSGHHVTVWFRDTNGQDHAVVGPDTLASGQWTHVVTTYDKVSGLGRLYYNGSLVAEQGFGSFTPNTGPTYSLWIGSRPDNVQYFGAIDEFSIYKRPLTPSEVADLFRAGASGKALPDDNLPPVVDAGPDVAVLNTSYAATLNGSITDDNKPYGPPDAVWSVVDYPTGGNVTFGNKYTANTTATFSLPGTYTLKLTADEHYTLPVSDTVVARVGAKAIEPPTGIVAWWPGDSHARDVVNGHDAEALSGVTYEPGKVAQGFVFNGTTSYLRVPGHSDLDIGSSSQGMTIEFWARWDVTSDRPLFAWMGPGLTGTNEYVRAWTQSSGRHVTAWLRGTDGLDRAVSGTDTLVAGQLVHLAVTYDKSTHLGRLFYNGAMVDERDWGLFTPDTGPTKALWIGSRSDNRQFKGLIDEFTLYNRALTPAEIRAIANAGSDGKTPPDTNTPPSVNAGPDLYLPGTGSTAALNGVVTDDQKPFGAPTVLWSLESGPVQPNFGDKTSAVTTATFTVPGTYLLRLTASDGYCAPVSDLVEVRVGATATPAPSGIAAWWPANGDTREIVNGGHDLDLGPGTTFVAGKVAEGLGFDGSTGFARVAGHSDFDVGAASAGMTIEFWARWDATYDQPLFSWMGAGLLGTNEYTRAWTQSSGHHVTMWARGTDGQDRAVVGPDTLASGQLVHLALTYDKATHVARLYYNGQIADERDWGLFTPDTGPTRTLWIGSRADNRSFKGMVDELTLYKRALTPTEINAIVSAGPDGKMPLGTNQAPVVSAGPFLALPTIGNATVAGTVTDDGKPSGVVATSWMQVNGPATWQPIQSNAITTSALFPANGTYLLKLTANDGLAAPVSDLTEARVGVSLVKPPSDIAAWWPANGRPREVVTGNHDLELGNGATYGDGRVSQGLVYDGISSFVRVAGSADLDIGSAPAGMTIEFWARWDLTSDRPLFAWMGPGVTGTNEYVRAWTQSSGRHVTVWARGTDGLDRAVVGPDTLTPGQLVHIAVTYDKSTHVARLSYNGNVVDERDWGSFTPDTGATRALWIGSRQDNRGYKGMIDEFTLYRRALSIAEIAAIAKANDGKAPPDANTPPVVDAGHDIVLSSANTSAPLKGVIADDQLPFGAPTVQWTQLAGPVTAPIDNKVVANTSVTFPAAGTYLFRLTGSDQYLAPVSDFVETRVAVAPAVAPADLAIWWTGNGHPHEAVTGKHDLELANGATYDTGAVLQGFVFDGNSSFARVPGHSDLDVGSSALGMTIEFWARWDLTADRPLFAWMGSGVVGSAESVRAWTQSNGHHVTVWFRGTDGFDRSLGGGDILSAGQLVHIAVTYDKNTHLGRLYYNGAKVAEQDWGVFTPDTGPSKTLWIGSRQDNRQFKGLIDEFSLYRRALAPTEIAAIYTAGAAGKGPVNAIPVVNAGADQSTYTNVAVALAGTASDDGLPNPPATLTYQWAQVSGPGTATFSTPNALTTNATFDAPGVYVVRLTASDSVLSGSDDLQVTVTTPASQPPAVTIYDPRNGAALPAAQAFTISAHATDSDGTIAKVEFFQGTTKLGEQTLPAADDSTTYFWTIPNGLPNGTYTFKARATDNTGVVTTSASITITTIADPGPPDAAISAPEDASQVTSPVAVKGAAVSGIIQSYVLDYRRAPASDSISTTGWQTFASGTTQMPAGSVLGTFDPTALRNGVYEIRLSVTDYAGRVARDTITVVADGKRKIGQYAESVTDFSLPAPGMPVKVIRNYDSRDTTLGDFGRGASLPSHQYAVQKTLAAADDTGARRPELGANWYEYTVSGIAGLVEYHLDPAPPQDATGVPPPPRVVAITLPNDDVYRFSARVTPNKQLGAPIDAVTVVFDPMPGSDSAKLEPIGDNQALVAGSIQFVDLMTYDTGEIWDPKAFRLTVADGTQYIIDQDFGLTQIVDRNGNSVSYGPNGVVHSSGQSLTLQRDAEGKITGIVDSAGHSVQYTYDAQSRLVQVTDREGKATSFTYAGNTTLMTSIQEPAAIRPAFNAWDALNRLQSRVDSMLNKTEFDHDPLHSTETRKDPLGNITTYEYDDVGRILQVTDPLGGITKYGYADRFNPFRATTVIDALGHTTTTTYNLKGLPLTVVDARGYTKSYEYNGFGLVTKETDQLGRITRSTYDANGNVLSVTDPAGAVTSYTYDAKGNLASEILPNGAVTTYVCDAAGLPTSEVLTDSTGAVISSKTFAYDLFGNLTRETYVQKDAAGNAVTRETRTEYDTNGHALKTTNPDGTVVTRTYDASGRLSTVTDARGELTTMQYDANGNLTTTTYPDGTHDDTAYDANSRPISRTDRRGFTTGYAYDAMDRITKVTQPDGGTLEFAYDLAGRVTQQKDGSGNASSFAYDENGNVTQVTFPDGTTSNVEYDAAGQVTSRSPRVFYAGTTQQNQTAAALKGPRAVKLASSAHAMTVAAADAGTPLSKYTFTYDGAGRIGTINNPDGSSATFTYDLLGRVTSTSNEKGATWSYSYDADPRAVARKHVTGPLGYAENYEYDGLGNILVQQDALGRGITRTYADFKLSKVKYPDGTSESYAYNTNGDLTGFTDRAGKETTIATTTSTGGGKKRVITRQVGVYNRTGSSPSLSSDTYTTTEQYDAHGNLVERKEEGGGDSRTTKYGYDWANRRVHIENPAGSTVDITYGPGGDVVATTESSGGTSRVTKYSYDGNHHLASITYPDRSVCGYRYDADGRLTLFTDANGNATKYDYEDTAHTLTITDPEGNVVLRTFDVFGNLLTEQDALGKITSFAYDDLGRLQTRTDALGGVESFSYDAIGNVLTRVDPLGRSTAYTYDDNDRPLAIETTGAEGKSTIAHTYDAMGNLASTTDARGKTTSFEFDELGRRRAVKAPANRNTFYALDVFGGVAAIYRQDGASYRVTQQTNDLAGRVVSRTRPTIPTGFGGSPTDIVDTFAYDGFGNLTSHTNSRSFTTTYAYDARNRATDITYPGGATNHFDYDSAGNLLKRTNARGFVTAYAYDKINRKVSEIVAAQRKTSYEYDGNSNVVKITRPSGQTIATTYDALNRLAEQTVLLDSASGQTYVRDFAYDKVGNLLSVKDGNGTTSHTYDFLNHLKDTTDAIGGTTAREVDLAGNVLSVTDARGHKTTMQYDDAGRLTSVTTPEGTTTTYAYDGYDEVVTETVGGLGTDGSSATVTTAFEYDGLGHLTKTTRNDTIGAAISTEQRFDGEDGLVAAKDGEGNVTAFTRDSRGRVTGVQHPNGDTESYAYDDEGNVTQRTDGAGHTRSFTFTPFDEVATATDGERNTFAYTYDDGGRLKTVADPYGNTARQDFDEAGRLVRSTLPDGTATTRGYDSFGNLTGLTDPSAHTARYEYDQLNRMTRARVPIALTADPGAPYSYAESFYTYDPLGNLLTLSDPNSNVTRYQYDRDNRVSAITLPKSGAVFEQFRYDNRGNRTLRTDATGSVTRYAFDAHNRLTMVTPDPTRGESSIAYTYDRRGLRTTMVDGLGQTTYGYDNRGRLTTKATPYAGALSYTYDGASNVLSARSSLPDGVFVHYAYDGNNRLAKTTDNSLGATTYTYDGAGRLTAVKEPNGAQIAYTPDQVGRVVHADVSVGGVAVRSFDYTYTPNGQIARASDSTGRQIDYTYDFADRLVSETMSGTGKTGAVTYTLDHAGNRLSRTSTVAGIAGQSYSYDSNNGLSSLSYDANGNPIGTDTYDFENRLAGRGTGLQFLYDGDGRRVGKRVFNGVLGRFDTTHFLIDDLSPTGRPQIALELRNGAVDTVYSLGLQRSALDTYFENQVSGGRHVVALDATGHVWAWGANDYGQLGNGSTGTASSSPTQVPGLDHVGAIAAGANHTVALKTDGTVWVWGRNDHGQLGVGAQPDQPVPVQVPGLVNVVAISTQLNHTLALLLDGSVYAWGDNSAGQLGDGTTTTQSTPVRVAGIVAREIAAGQLHSLALGTDGLVYTWGDNSHAQLGRAISGDHDGVPTAVTGVGTVRTLAAGTFHTLALETDGHLSVWGDNAYGQLGDGSVSSHAVPERLTSLAGVAAIAAGSRHSVAALSDGSVYAWGDNRFGQLGVGDQIARLTPTLVAGLAGVTQLAAGGRNTAAVMSTGAVYAWGDNTYGQLGIAGLGGATAPQPVSVATALSSIAAGGEGGADPRSYNMGFDARFYGYDGLGHVGFLTSSTGLVTDNYTYDAFGNVLDRTGTTKNEYLYRGERLDSDTGLYHLAARDYDPAVGRFRTIDSFAGITGAPLSHNRYAYAEGNPVGKADPSGHIAVNCLAGAVYELHEQTQYQEFLGSIGPAERLLDLNALTSTDPYVDGPRPQVVKKERSVSLRATPSNVLGSLELEAGYDDKSYKGLGAGSDIYFVHQSAARFRQSPVEKLAENAWSTLQNLRSNINTGPKLPRDFRNKWPVRLQNRWSDTLYYQAILQASALSVHHGGADIQATFANQPGAPRLTRSSVAVTSAAQIALNGNTGGGPLNWKHPAEGDYFASAKHVSAYEFQEMQVYWKAYEEHGDWVMANLPYGIPVIGGMYATFSSAEDAGLGVWATWYQTAVGTVPGVSSLYGALGYNFSTGLDVRGAERAGAVAAFALDVAGLGSLADTLGSAVRSVGTSAVARARGVIAPRAVASELPAVRGVAAEARAEFELFEGEMPRNVRNVTPAAERIPQPALESGLVPESMRLESGMAREGLIGGNDAAVAGQHTHGAFPIVVRGGSIQTPTSGYYASLMGVRGLARYTRPAATLGVAGGNMWMAPLEDYAGLATRSDVVTASGHAPSITEAYLRGEPMYGIAVPTNSINVRLPVVADAMGSNSFKHWRPGGFTGVEHNGVWTSSGVREVVTPGGIPVPQGSVFFQINPNGTWTVIRRF